MDLARLDAAVHQYCVLGLALFTNKAYRRAINRFSSFCTEYSITTSFRVNEPLLCRFVTALAEEGLALATIKTYLAGVGHAQIMRGLPKLRHGAEMMARLKLVQSGIACESHQGHRATRQAPPDHRANSPKTGADLDTGAHGRGKGSGLVRVHSAEIRCDVVFLRVV